VSSGFLAVFFLVPIVPIFELEILLTLAVSMVCKVSSSDFAFSSLISSDGLFALVFFLSPACDYGFSAFISISSVSSL
jgi:hypothetical protein